LLARDIDCGASAAPRRATPHPPYATQKKPLDVDDNETCIFLGCQIRQSIEIARLYQLPFDLNYESFADQKLLQFFRWYYRILTMPMEL
jgi:hypothetical protein